MATIEAQPSRTPLIDYEKLGEGLATRMRRYVDEQIERRLAALPAPVVVDVQEVAQRAASLIPKPADGKDGARGQDGQKGADGASVTPEDLEPMLARMLAKALEALPKPRDGADGRDGRDGASVTIEAVATLVNAEVAKAVQALPKPADGKDGAPGRDGKDGQRGEKGADGKDGETPTVDLHEVAEIIKADPEMVTLLRGERGEIGPRGDRGEQGIAGKDGRDGIDGRHGQDGAPGADGKSVTPDEVREVVENRFNGWALEFERRANDIQQKAINAIPLPRDGRDGERGRDGLGLDDFELRGETPDGGRTIVLELSAGGRVRTVQIRTAAVLDRGTFDAQKRYEAGDAITFGGHLWVCQKDAPQGRPGESPDFRLAVRRGRDAKE